VEDLSTKTCLVADQGLFVEMASRLARDFGKVYYWTPWMSGYPNSANAHIGAGLPGVKRVLYFWDHVEEADVVVFPDLYMADMARAVRDKFGKPVWCHFNAELIELDRVGTRKLQRELGISSPKTRFFTGIDDLAEYLKTADNKWVKISCFRGDGETWHHDTWDTSAVYLDYFRNKTGALANTHEFMVEENIEGIEIGYDGWTVHGQFPDSSYWGFEVKSEGYVGEFSKNSDMPDCLCEINDSFSGILKSEKSSGFISFECRVGGDRRAYLIDPCIRAGSPPNEGTQEGYANFSEIVWEGANGRMCRPKSLGKYVVMAAIKSSFAMNNWTPLEIPKADRQWVKVRNAALIDKKLYYVPIRSGEETGVGMVVAVDDDLEKAIALVKKRASRVKGFRLDIHTEALDSAQEEIEKAARYGVKF
jgi:hypothetical protein